jgi:hypothetical protein
MIATCVFITLVGAAVLGHQSSNHAFNAAVLIGAVALGLGGYLYVIFRPDIRKWRRRRAGLCVGCGYDRRGAAADAPCPECGLAP